jgi:hypothetical protein
MANVTGWKMEQPTASHIKYKNKSLKIPKGSNQNPYIEEQHNGIKNKYKKTNNDLQNIHIKLKITVNKISKNANFIINTHAISHQGQTTLIVNTHAISQMCLLYKHRVEQSLSNLTAYMSNTTIVL